MVFMLNLANANVYSALLDEFQLPTESQLTKQIFLFPLSCHFDPVLPGGDPAAAAVLHREPAAAQHLPDGDGHCWFLLAARQRREGLLQDHSAAGLLRLPHHRL